MTNLCTLSFHIRMYDAKWFLTMAVVSTCYFDFTHNLGMGELYKCGGVLSFCKNEGSKRSKINEKGENIYKMLKNC